MGCFILFESRQKKKTWTTYFVYVSQASPNA